MAARVCPHPGEYLPDATLGRAHDKVDVAVKPPLHNLREKGWKRGCQKPQALKKALNQGLCLTILS